jgi:prepilin-type processing-associated H-X9-DG protein
VKEILLALHMYIGDWDGFYPFYTSGAVGAEPGITGLMPYVENNFEMFRCPLDNSVPAAGTHLCSYNFPEAQVSVHWGYVGVFGDCCSPGVIRYKARNIDDVEAPGNVVILAEAGGIGQALENMGCAQWVLFQRSTRSQDYPHGGDTPDAIGNFGFADGHAKGLKWDMPCTQWCSPRLPGFGCSYCWTVDDMYAMDIMGP